MREIKFRAWDGKSVRYDVTGFEHGEKNEMSGVFLDGDYWRIGERDTVLKTYDRCAEVMQYTGLMDNTGKEIYEGDLVKCTSLANGHSEGGAVDVMVIRPWMGNFCFCFPGQTTGTAMWPTKLLMFVEIIGNIYENRELLEE